MAVNWINVGAFAFQHLSTGVMTANGAQAASGIEPFSKEWWSIVGMVALSGGANHLRNRAAMTTPAPKPQVVWDEAKTETRGGE